MNADDPLWPRASAWLASGNAERPQLGVIDVPLNQSITPGRCDLAPAAIRKALERYSTFDPEGVVDLGSVTVRDFGEAENIANCISQCECALLIGGDNNVTRIGVQALGLPLDRVGLLTFDAHHDVRDTSLGVNNGNPVRTLIEAGMPGRNVVQIGIAPFTNSPTYAAYARENRIGIETVEEVYLAGIDAIVRRSLNKLAASCDAIYVDLDVDVLDRAFAPGCPGARPGGLQPRMLRRAARMCGHAPKVRAMDVVEVDPTKDVADVTVLAAASFLLAFAAGVAARNVT